MREPRRGVTVSSIDKSRCSQSGPSRSSHRHSSVVAVDETLARLAVVQSADHHQAQTNLVALVVACLGMLVDVTHHRCEGVHIIAARAVFERPVLAPLKVFCTGW